MSAGNADSQQSAARRVSHAEATRVSVKPSKASSPEVTHRAGTESRASSSEVTTKTAGQLQLSPQDVTHQTAKAPNATPLEVQENTTNNNNEYSDEFETFWIEYPKRPGNPKRKAFRCWNARIREGVTPQQMIDGAKQYAASRCGENPKYTKHASTFLGPDRHFETTWEQSDSSMFPPQDFEGIWNEKGAYRGVYFGS